MTKKPLRFAFFGAGFWARFQLSAWRELPDVECVAVYNRSLEKGRSFAKEFNISAVYDDVDELLRYEEIDFVDVCTHPSTLSEMVRTIAAHGVPIITQKPMAPNLVTARENLRLCSEAGVPYFIHENWRWQPQLRAIKEVIDSGLIGDVFRARITMVSGFPVFENEPHLKELEEFILTDMGAHTLDLARFLFDEADSLYCQVHKVNKNIQGEDVSTTILSMNKGQTTVTVEMGYAQNHLEKEAFPETFLFIEGSLGSVDLCQNFWIRTTTESGTHSRKIAPFHYSWADPDYDVVHASIVECNRNLLNELMSKGKAETTAGDNLKTLELVYACYESARSKSAIHFD